MRRRKDSLYPSVWLLSVFLLIFYEGEVAACSGPGARSAILESIAISKVLGLISLVMVMAGCTFSRRGSQGRRITWIVGTALLYPGWWISANHGDCGQALVFWTLVHTISTAVALALTIFWPDRGNPISTGREWPFLGAIVGALVGILVAALFVESHFGAGFLEESLLAISIVGGSILTGCLAVTWIHRFRKGKGLSTSFNVATLLLLPIAVAPLFVALLPVLPYTASTSLSAPFSFFVVDAETGRPIPGAEVRVIDPKFSPDDGENQGPTVVTAADGVADYMIIANIHGRHGLLGNTETTSYYPYFVHVVSPAHQRFVASLSNDPPLVSVLLTDPPVGLSFPRRGR